MRGLYVFLAVVTAIVSLTGADRRTTLWRQFRVITAKVDAYERPNVSPGS
jgi:hypothetical protein